MVILVLLHACPTCRRAIKSRSSFFLLGIHGSREGNSYYPATRSYSKYIRASWSLGASPGQELPRNNTMTGGGAACLENTADSGGTVNNSSYTLGVHAKLLLC